MRASRGTSADEKAQQALGVGRKARRSHDSAISRAALRFRVALSFPGERRPFIEQVAEHLSAAVGREQVLYDKYFEAEFARVDLDLYLPRLYREQSELVVIFLCRDYALKRWCQLEWRHIRQLIATLEADRIMLASFGSPGDLSEIGVLPGDGYMDIERRPSSEIAGLILQRLGNERPPLPRPSPLSLPPLYVRTRILIADDHAIVRTGLRKILEAHWDFEVVAEAGTAAEAITQARVSRPDVILLDVSMPGPPSLEAVEILKCDSPSVRIVFLTVHPEDHFAVHCLKAGADGYLTKDVSSWELVDAIRRVQRGDKYLSRTLAERLLESFDEPHHALSNREFEVLRRIGRGMDVPEIALALRLSAKTVSVYRQRLLAKMNMKTNAELKRYAVERGLAG